MLFCTGCCIGVVWCGVVWCGVVWCGVVAGPTCLSPQPVGCAGEWHH